MEIRRFTFNPFQTNCYVLSDAGDAVIIDPSSASESEHEALAEYIDSSDLTVKHVLLTHAHLDHIFGVAPMCARYDVPYLMHRADLLLMQNAPEQGRLFGVEVDDAPEPGGYLDEDSCVVVGGVRLAVAHTPGHSPGSISFVSGAEGVAICGDVLFAGSIGRTDLWQGSLPVLMRSIFDKLVPLGPEAVIYPGHGPQTTIGQELRDNPFLKGTLEPG